VTGPRDTELGNGEDFAIGDEHQSFAAVQANADVAAQGKAAFAETAAKHASDFLAGHLIGLGRVRAFAALPVRKEVAILAKVEKISTHVGIQTESAGTAIRMIDSM
jgi:hypothetical protein